MQWFAIKVVMNHTNLKLSIFSKDGRILISIAAVLHSRQTFIELAASSSACTTGLDVLLVSYLMGRLFQPLKHSTTSKCRLKMVSSFTETNWSAANGSGAACMV